ncbi:hypothetical protein MCAP1_002105 [Malassezia caprae]|uniref:SRP9 domain-containing protein n=1 Tax=Malassezia caprae TaxID=1381934 RepID=A0AAF0E8Q1_9BASI|nr:hypothetical protein MCAP1_002105 [Malassezia caprae]
MVYVKRWSEFKARALALQAARPERARMVLKAQPKTQTLVVKITDDHETLKYRAKSQIILNRFDELQRLMLEAMAGIEAPPPAPEPEPASAAPPAPKSGGKKKKGKKK